MRIIKRVNALCGVAALLCVCGILQTGCQRTAGAGAKAAHGGTGWDAPEEPQLPGITSANIRWYCLGDRLKYVIWTDLAHSGVGSGSSGSTASGVDQHDAEFFGRGGERLLACLYRGANDEGSIYAGEIVIDDQAYELDKGRLLLVSTRGDATHVKQLDVDPMIVRLLQDRKTMSGQEAREAFRAVSDENSDVRSFFADSGGKVDLE